ncbi:MAG TPA: YopJ family acetyltransferase [Burkholderiaceae bacterium]
MTITIRQAVSAEPAAIPHDHSHEGAPPSNAAPAPANSRARPAAQSALGGLHALQSTARGAAAGVSGVAAPAAAAINARHRVALGLRAQPRADMPAGDDTGIAKRLGDMKAYLADLRAAFAAEPVKLEMRGSRDTEFLDLLVAVENARMPTLRLSAHAIDYKRLSRGDDPAAVGSLARRLVAGMHMPQTWHAIVDMNGHQVALSVRHALSKPMHVSIVVVDSTAGEFSARDWSMVASSLVDHLNEALDDERKPRHARKPRDAKVWFNNVHTSIQKTEDGSAIFALAAAREMLGDPDIEQLHKEALDHASGPSKDFGVRVSDGDKLLGARFFKHMTLRSNMHALLEARPELEDEPVNKKGQTLRQRQEGTDERPGHLAQHRPWFGLPYEFSASYEKKRLRMFERAIGHIETAAAPELAAARAAEPDEGEEISGLAAAPGFAARIEGMRDYLIDLHRARKGKAKEGEPALPAARDAEFLDILAEAENAADPQLRLSTHKLDQAKLARRDDSAVASLSAPLAEGVRNGEDWRATLDLDGRHIALSAHHDASNHAHVSIVLFDGAGLPLPAELAENLSLMLAAQLRRNLPASAGGKVWLTQLKVSQAAGNNGALLALMAAIGMKDYPGIDEVHAQALAAAQASANGSGVREGNGDALLDSEDGAAREAVSERELLHDQIQMYKDAIGHFELMLAS